MKNFAYLIFVLFFGLATACVKFPSPTPSPIDKPSSIKSLEDTKISDNFSWSTSKNVEVIITGLPTLVTIKSTLTISLKDGTKLISLFHEMSQSLKLKIVVPYTTETIRLRYGSGVYDLDVKNNKVDFSFIPKTIN